MCFADLKNKVRLRYVFFKSESRVRLSMCFADLSRVKTRYVFCRSENKVRTQYVFFRSGRQRSALTWTERQKAGEGSEEALSRQEGNRTPYCSAGLTRTRPGIVEI